MARRFAKAREGLLATDHSKRGRRFVTILDPGTETVTLLEPWEHAILVLSDGTRSSAEIAALIEPIDGEHVDGEAVVRCLKFFERQGLIEELGLRDSTEAPPGPRTLAELQVAYQEWHKDPARTGQFASWASPGFPGPTPPVGPTFEDPTTVAPADRARRRVAVGSTLVLAEGASVLIDSQPGTTAPQIAGPATDAQARAVLAQIPLDDDVSDVSDALEASEDLDVLSAIDEAVSEALDQRTAPARDARLDHLLENPVVDVGSALNPTRIGAPAEPTERGRRIAAWVNDDPTLETLAAVPSFPAKRELESADQTQLGVLVHGQREPSDSGGDRVRTATTGARPPAGVSRKIFEHLVAVVAAQDRKAGRRGAAKAKDVYLALDEVARVDVVAHFRRLLRRMPEARRVAALVGAIEGSADSDSPAGAASVGPMLAGVIDEASRGGRCVSCLGRVESGFTRCAECGYQPPRRRRGG